MPLPSLKTFTPARLFFLTALVVLFVDGGYFGWTLYHANDINLHDMSYIETKLKGLVAVVLVLFVLGISYVILNHLLADGLNNAPGYLHYLLTLLWVIALRLLQYTLPIGEPPRRYYSLESSHPSTFDQFNPIILLMVLIGCVFQLVFVFNIVRAIVKTRKHKRD